MYGLAWAALLLPCSNYLNTLKMIDVTSVQLQLGFASRHLERLRIFWTWATFRLDEEKDEILATECRFFQPQAAAGSSGGSLSEYIYRVPHPYCSILYKSCPMDEHRLDVIALFVQPVDEETIRAHALVSVIDNTSTDLDIRLFQQSIFSQDKPILENQFPKKLPLDPRAETPIRADKAAIVYRRWLRDKGLQYGVIPAAA